jgi:DGQHR domain-containing protein
MVTQGDALNFRVWRLFDRAGFQTQPNAVDVAEESVTLPSGKNRTVDLSARLPDLRVKIIGENTVSRKLPESFSTYIHDMASIMSSAKANAGLLVYTKYKPDPSDVELAEQKRIKVWDEERLRYYEAVVEALGQYAKYELIHSFGLKTAEERNTHTALALRFNQPFAITNTEVFLFTVTPEVLLKTCVLYRRAQGSHAAYQRMLNKNRLRSVANFVRRETALLPTDIIVHLGPKVRVDELSMPEADAKGRPITLSRDSNYDLVSLSIPMIYASLELIDGQHRLYGFIHTEPATQKDFNLVVVGLRALPECQKRETFVAINDNSRRMDPNLVAYLKYTDDLHECCKYPEIMAIYIVVNLARSSPFQGRIRLLDFGDERLTLKGFCGYSLRGLLGPRGLLRIYYENSPDKCISALRTYFGILKSLFPKQWKEPDKYIMFTNRGISAFLMLLRSMLKTQNGRIGEAIIRKYLESLRRGWSDDQWETAKLKNSFVGSKGWKDFHRAIVDAIRKEHPGFQE